MKKKDLIKKIKYSVAPFALASIIMTSGCDNNNVFEYRETQYIKIIRLINNKTNDSKYYMINEYENIEFDGDTIFCLYDILTDNKILELDQSMEVKSDSSIISYEYLGSLSEYLVTSDSFKSEYTKEELKVFLDNLVIEVFNTKNKELVK